MKKSAFSIKRLVLNAVLIALYVVLSFLKIPIGNLLRVNMASFAVVVSAVAFTPIDGLWVGFLGEFLAQILGPYGLTPTTVLWALSAGLYSFRHCCIFAEHLRSVCGFQNVWLLQLLHGLWCADRSSRSIGSYVHPVRLHHTSCCLCAAAK